MNKEDIYGLFSIDFATLGAQTIALMLTATLLPRLKITGIFGAFFTVLCLSLINNKIWDAALFFKVPDSLSLHALSLFLANGVLFFILVKIIPGIQIKGFLPAFYAPLVFTLCSFVITEHMGDINWLEVWEYSKDTVTNLREYFLAAEIPQEN